MSLSSYHTHSTYSDGKSTLEEMVQSAIEQGCEEIGFSDHAPMSFRCDWSARAEKIESYKKEVNELKEKYKGKIKIFLGIEQDYFSTPAEGYDYIIGSVHFVYKDGEYIPVDISAEEVKSYIDRLYGGDVYGYCEDYFKLVKDIYKVTECQIIGHFDLVTKFNERMPLIDINHPRYVKAVDDALEALLDTPAIFEVNTGAISREYRTTPYPDDRTMEIIAKKGKEFVITSDTHHRDTVTFNFAEQEKALTEKGYKYIKSLGAILKPYDYHTTDEIVTRDHARTDMIAAEPLEAETGTKCKSEISLEQAGEIGAFMVRGMIEKYENELRKKAAENKDN